MNKKTKKVLLTVFCAVLLVAGSVMGTLAYLTDKTDQVVNTFTVGKVDISLDEAKVKYDTENKKYVVDSTANPARVLENEYHILPGMVFPKDPTITVEKGSENCYVGAVVTLTVDDITKTPLWNADYGQVILNGFVTGGIADDTTWAYDSGTTYKNQAGDTITQVVTPGTTTGSGDTATKTPDVITFTYIFKDPKAAETKIVLFTQLSTLYNVELWTNEALDALTVTKTDVTTNETTESFEITVDAYAVQADGFTDAKTALQTAFNTTGENAVTIF